jgi:hypothetical protein
MDMYSRVTHPSATICHIQQAFNNRPFDLHVLSTPPAFVLSQDQTLQIFQVLRPLYPYALYSFFKVPSPRSDDGEKYTTHPG